MRTLMAVLPVALLSLVAPAWGQGGVVALREMVPPAPCVRAALADVDGDGDQDIVSLGGGVLLNQGSAVFVRHPTVSTALFAVTAGPHGYALAVADFNGDGAADACILAANQVRLLMNNGAGVLVDASTNLPPPPTSTGGFLHLGIIARDVDGDSDVDLLLGGYESTGLGPPPILTPLPFRLWINSSLGTFVDVSSNLPPLAGAGLPMALADVDADGDEDVIISMVSGVPLGASQRVLWVNAGNGVFTASAATLGSNVPISAIAVGDVDGDGLPDLEIVNANAPVGMTEEFVRNLGGGTFAPAVFDSGSFAADVVFADVQGSAAPELLRWSYYPNETVSVHPFNGTNGFAAATVAFPARATAPFPGPPPTGDLDADGDTDLVVVDRGRLRLALGDGAGSLIPARSTLEVPSSAIAQVAGDVDGDGSQDVLFAQYSGVALFLAANDLSGRFAVPASACPGCPATNWGKLALLDADGDGDLDLYSAAGPQLSGGGIDYFALNATGTSFANPVPLTGLGNASSVRSGDADGDGDADVVIARACHQFASGGLVVPCGVPLATALVSNLGGGAWAAPLAIPGSAAVTFDIALADLDGDGDLDVVQANDSLVGGPPPQLLLNNGSGAFVVSPLPMTVARSVDVGDLDGDGDLDLLLGAQVMLNAGAGSFLAGPTLGPGISPTSLALVDAEGDGDLDAVTFDGASLQLFLNQGSATFGVSSIIGPLALPTTGSISKGDFDLDGDVDLLVPGPYVLTNMTRQLASMDLPRLGKAGSLLLANQPGAPYALFVSGFRLSPPLAVPPFGTILIDPLLALPLVSATIGPSGSSPLHFFIPMNSALVGLPIYLQAVFPAELRLSSLEAIDITAL